MFWNISLKCSQNYLTFSQNYCEIILDGQYAAPEDLNMNGGIWGVISDIYPGRDWIDEGYLIFFFNFKNTNLFSIKTKKKSFCRIDPFPRMYVGNYPLDTSRYFGDSMTKRLDIQGEMGSTKDIKKIFFFNSENIS